MPMPLAAVACQECAAVPGTQVAVFRVASGVTQLTSPESVEEYFCPLTRYFWISLALETGGRLSPTSVVRSFSAKADSSVVHVGAPTRRRVESMTRPRTSLGRML